jgi:hypothetical protein
LQRAKRHITDNPQPSTWVATPAPNPNGRNRVAFSPLPPTSEHIDHKLMSLPQPPSDHYQIHPSAAIDNNLVPSTSSQTSATATINIKSAASTLFTYSKHEGQHHLSNRFKISAHIYNGSHCHPNDSLELSAHSCYTRHQSSSGSLGVIPEILSCSPQ